MEVWDVFGSDIANIGDLNGDGNIDIAVGARRDGDGGEQRGAVLDFF
ncbi:MAG: integrin alpha [Flavobacteriaceae bacterium]